MSLQQHSLAGLKPLRLARNMRREDLAQVIGVTATSYDRFENGTRRIYFDKAIMLARALGVSVDALTIDPGLPAATPSVLIQPAADGALIDELKDWQL